jgi:dihydroorotase-like cyclic amidohydrolase
MFSEGVVKRGLSPVKLAQLLSENPARRFHLFPKKGRIALDGNADLAVLDPNIRWTLRGEEMHSSARWSPYEGMFIQGKVVRTILRGEIIFDGKKVIAEPGHGQFLPAQEG